MGSSAWPGRQWPGAVWRQLRILVRGRRWAEYSRCLQSLLARGYDVVPFDKWLESPTGFGPRVAALRHDVDLDSTSALRANEIEKSLGVSSTFYFRWCTFDLTVIGELLDGHATVGLHYETLTRMAWERRLSRPEQVTPELLLEARSVLKAEISAFNRLAGPTRSTAAHGDRISFAIKRRNEEVLEGESIRDYGIQRSADDSRLLKEVGRWVSDDDGVVGSWSRGLSLDEAVEQGESPTVFNTHPHHWDSGRTAVLARSTSHLRWAAKCGFANLLRPEALAWRSFREAV